MNKKIFLYIAVGLVILGLITMTFFPNMIYLLRDIGKTGNSICNPPPGVTAQEWQIHMSHHPDMYKDCLS